MNILLVIIVLAIMTVLLIDRSRDDPLEIMRKKLLEKFNSWYEFNQGFPARIVLPRRMFEAFKKDMKKTNHALTIMDIPVEPGDVSEIHFVRS